MGLVVSGAIVVIAGCGGADSGAATTTVPATTAVPTTVAPTTIAPTTTIDPAGQFDLALDAALGAAIALADLRVGCFQLNDLGCLIDAGQEILDAEAAAIDRLTELGSAATAAGAPPDRCEATIESTVTNVRSEGSLLSFLAQQETAAGQPSAPDDAAYWNLLREDRIGRSGQELALGLLGCVNAVRSLVAEHSISNSFASLVYNAEIRSRPSLMFNHFVVFRCLDQPPTDGVACIDAFSVAGPLQSHLEELGYGYEGLLEDPSYATLPEECRMAVDDSTARLQESYRIFLDISTRELVSTDAELLRQITRGLFLIDERQRAETAPPYSLDESTVLRCVAAIGEADA